MGLAMAETVSVRLANVPGLQVVTPRAAIDESSSKDDPSFARVARRLGANTLLSGSLQRENERYRITYRLVDDKGNQLAAGTMDGSELFALQDRVADGVVRDLSLRRGARRTPTPSGLETVADQERYLQAIGLLHRYDKREGVERAMQILSRLAEEKPQLGSRPGGARPGGPRDVRFHQGSDVGRPRRRGQRRRSRPRPEPAGGRRHRRRDVPRHGTGPGGGRGVPSCARREPGKGRRPARAGARSEALGDDLAAEKAFERAAKLQPSFAVFNQLGALRAARGRWLAAAEWFRKATDVAPDSYRAYSNLGGVLVLGCDFETAIPMLRKALELRPADPIAASNLGLTLLWTGRPGEAVKQLETATRNAPNNFQVWVVYGDFPRGDQREGTSRPGLRSSDRARTRSPASESPGRRGARGVGHLTCANRPRRPGSTRAGDGALAG